MRSVKLKLFLYFSLTIFAVLFVLSLSSAIFFTNNYETKTLSKLDTVYASVENSLIKKDKNAIFDIRKDKNIFILVQKSDNIYFTDLTKKESEEILKEIKYGEIDYEYSNYLEVDDYIINAKTLQIDSVTYNIYIGMDESVLEDLLEELYTLVIVLNSTLFVILTTLGYMLINKTISPLKLILDDLYRLKNKKDLSQRLENQNTNDEFERVTTTLNEMLEWIEASVENIKQFSSDASHELRTPLTIIQGEIELAQKRESTKDELLKTLANVDIEQKKLQNIISDLLLLSKLDKNVLESENSYLDCVIFDVIESNLSAIESKSLELKLDIEENLEVKFAQKYLFIVINNLLTNAIKYTNEGTISIEAKSKNQQIEFLIKDSGIGIDKENLSKIFERFYRVDEARSNSQDGLGLGLSIVKKICDRFESSIEVKSEMNTGTTFAIQMKKRKNNE